MFPSVWYKRPELQFNNPTMGPYNQKIIIFGGSGLSILEMGRKYKCEIHILPAMDGSGYFLVPGHRLRKIKFQFDPLLNVWKSIKGLPLKMRRQATEIGPWPYCTHIILETCTCTCIQYTVHTHIVQQTIGSRLLVKWQTVILELINKNAEIESL